MTATPPEASTDLAVPGEPGVYWCARHRKVQTRLRCGRCETPICPKCTVMGPTGARCRDCGSNRSSHIYQVSPLGFLLAFGMSFAFGWLGSFLSGVGGLFLVFFSPVIGSFLGKGIIRATGGKRGVPLAVVASAGVVLGGLLIVWPAASHLLAPLATNIPPEGRNDAAQVLLLDALWPSLFCGGVLASVWYWVR